jgi:hypothetical protein
MIFALLGSVLGAATRLAPEVLKFFDRNADRKHEAAMFDKQLVADKQRADLNIRQIEAQDAATMNAKDFEALIAATTAQAAPTGIKWVDALTASVRPVLTYWHCIVLWTGAKIAAVVLLAQAKQPVIVLVAGLWGPGEEAIAASMISYWFVDRTLRKGGGVSAAH